jgi:hypoxanthine-guanine phosphoribosyltransferase
VILATTESAVKQHAEYEAAKTGDVASAKRLAAQLTADATLQAIRAVFSGGSPALVPVHAVEDLGYNRIPGAFAELLAERLNLEVETGIIQANVVNHTGASGWQRMVRPAVFEGAVIEGREYFLVDDFVGQGGTLANLRGYLMQSGGRVLGATTLTGRADSATLALRSDTLTALRATHGDEIENWWQDVFGYRFDCLTESEARYLVRVENADTIRARLVEAGSEEHH